MKLQKITVAFILLHCFAFTSNCFAQTNDAIRMILSAKTFSITEKYVGVPAGYIYKYTFTKNEKMVDLVWEEEIANKTIVKGKTTISLTELNTMETMFNDCIVKIKKNKQKGSDKNSYIFNDENSSYEIDDNSSMVCVDDLKAWRTNVFKKK